MYSTMKYYLGIKHQKLYLFKPTWVKIRKIKVKIIIKCFHSYAKCKQENKPTKHNQKWCEA